MQILLIGLNLDMLDVEYESGVAVVGSVCEDDHVEDFSCARRGLNATLLNTIECSHTWMH
jgi:hypothetical protein